jgi:hypothetical protein
MARFAEGTTVTVQSSRGEITGILSKHGVDTMAWGSSPSGDQLQFELDGCKFRFTIPRPTQAEAYRLFPNSRRSVEDLLEAEWRRRWRAHVLLIKAKLEFASGGDTTIEREFMPYMLVGGNRTLADWIETEQAQKLLAAGNG